MKDNIGIGRGQEQFIYNIKRGLKNSLRLFFYTALITLIIDGLYFAYNPPRWHSRKITDHLKKIKKMPSVDNFEIFFEEISKEIKNNFRYNRKYYNELLIRSLLIEFVLIISLSYFFYRKSLFLKKDEYVRGTFLASPNILRKEMKSFIKNEVRDINKSSAHLITEDQFWGRPFICAKNVEIPQFILERHLSFIGSTGVGKSTLMKHYLDYIRKMNEKAIILDINGEIFSEFGQPNDIILSLFDKRSTCWDFAHEIESIGPMELAKMLIITKEENDYWTISARSVLQDILSKFNNLVDLKEILIHHPDRITENLSTYSKTILGKDKSNQMSGIISHALAQLSFLEFVKDPGPNKVSLYNWSRSDDPRWIFISLKDSDLSLLDPITRVWFNSAILGILERPPLNNLKKVNIIIDELNSIGKLEYLPKLLERGRKYGAKVALGFQSRSQLIDKYGPKANNIMANIGTHFIFRVLEGEEAEYYANILGKGEFYTKRFSESLSSKDINNHDGISEGENVSFAVLPSEIQSLPDGSFYLKSINFLPTRLKIDKKRWPKIYDLHIDQYERYFVKNNTSIDHSDLFNI